MCVTYYGNYNTTCYHYTSSSGTLFRMDRILQLSLSVDCISIFTLIIDKAVIEIILTLILRAKRARRRSLGGNTSASNRNSFHDNCCPHTDCMQTFPSSRDDTLYHLRPLLLSSHQITSKSHLP